MNSLFYRPDQVPHYQQQLAADREAIEAASDADTLALAEYAAEETSDCLRKCERNAQRSGL
jgi:hypothetical protein